MSQFLEVWLNMRQKDIALHVFFSWRTWSFTGDLRVVEAAAWSVMEIRNPLAKTSLDLALNSQPSKKKYVGSPNISYHIIARLWIHFSVSSFDVFLVRCQGHQEPTSWNKVFFKFWFCDLRTKWFWPCSSHNWCYTYQKLETCNNIAYCCGSAQGVVDLHNTGELSSMYTPSVWPWGARTLHGRLAAPNRCFGSWLPKSTPRELHPNKTWIAMPFHLLLLWKSARCSIPVPFTSNVWLCIDCVWAQSLAHMLSSAVQFRDCNQGNSSTLSSHPFWFLVTPQNCGYHLCFPANKNPCVWRQTTFPNLYFAQPVLNPNALLMES